MPISFASAVGNLFDALGKIGNLMKQVKSYQASQQTNMIDTTAGVVAQFNDEPDIQAIMGNSYIGLLSSDLGILGLCQNMAAQTINRIVFRDDPQLNQTLTSQNTLQSISEVIRQMKQQGATVQALTVTATPGSFTGTGNGVVVASVRRPSDGIVLENIFAEDLLFTCTSDSYLGGATAGNETITVTGTGSQDNLLAFNWPLGSNAQQTLNVIDGDASNSSGNLLTNSSFNAWTGGEPDNWDVTIGLANVTQESNIVYSGGSSLKLTGDSDGTLTSWNQKFSDSSGTLGSLSPLTQYSFNVFVRRDGIAAAAGTLVIELVDGNGTIISDILGVNDNLTIDLTGLSTDWTAYNVVWRLPLTLATSDYYIRMRLSTALTNGRAIYIDKASLGQMTQIYTGGPFANVHAGNSNFVQGDYASLVMTNSRGTGVTPVSTWQSLLWMLFPDGAASEILWPSAASPSIADALIG